LFISNNFIKNIKKGISMATGSEGQNQFKIFDRIFWAIWLVLPVTIWLTYNTMMADSVFMAVVPESCRSTLPIVSKFSTTGKVAVASFFLWQFALYVIVIAMAHRTIRRCMRGDVLVADILRTLGFIGIVIVSWVFIQLLVANAMKYVIFLTGDVPLFEPEYGFDVGLPALGILILAMRAVIAYAIEIKQDQDLTI
jgi:hypothetical protein